MYDTYLLTFTYLNDLGRRDVRDQIVQGALRLRCLNNNDQIGRGKTYGEWLVLGALPRPHPKNLLPGSNGPQLCALSATKCVHG